MREQPAFRGLWAAIECSADNSAELLMLRERLGPEGDVYYYRAVLWAMAYSQETGAVEGRWESLRLVIRFPGGARDLETTFREAGIVVGPLDTLWRWEIINGWQVEKRAEDRRRQKAKRRAGKRSAAVRRKKAADARKAREGKK